MNAVLTEAGVCRSALWGSIWFGMDFQESVFPDLGSLGGITAKESKRKIHFVVSLCYFLGLSGRFLTFWP